LADSAFGSGSFADTTGLRKDVNLGIAAFWPSAMIAICGQQLLGVKRG